jgi:hypothetical protein
MNNLITDFLTGLPWTAGTVLAILIFRWLLIKHFRVFCGLLLTVLVIIITTLFGILVNTA